MKRTGLLSLMGTFLLGIALVLGAAPCAAYAEVPSAEFYTNASRELNHWIQLDLEDGSHLKGMAPRTFDASCVYMGEIIPAREWNGSSLVEGQVAGYLPVYQVDADDPMPTRSSSRRMSFARAMGHCVSRIPWVSLPSMRFSRTTIRRAWS